jgi:hypothetical protein
MRHLAGFVLAIVTAVAVFFAGGWGYLRLLRFARPFGTATGTLARLPASGGSLIPDHAVVVELGVLLAVGLVLGIMIGVPAISPLASGLPGLAMLALTALYLVNVRRAVTIIPLRTTALGFGAGVEDMLVNGVLAVAGLAMIVPLFVPSRWRRRGAGADDEEEDSILTAAGLSPEQQVPDATVAASGPIPQGPRREYPARAGEFPGRPGSLAARTEQLPPRPSFRPPQDPPA